MPFDGNYDEPESDPAPKRVVTFWDLWLLPLRMWLAAIRLSTPHG